MSDADRIWRAKSDDELLEAAADLSEFTADGERIIRAELRRRGLPEPGRAIGACPRCGRAIPRTHESNDCSQCGEPLPPEILRALGAAAAGPADISITAKTPTGQSLSVTWEVVACQGAEFSLWRAPIPGGWLVVNDDGGMTFVPDAEHKWNESVS